MARAIFSVEIRNANPVLPDMASLYEYENENIRDGCGYSCIGYCPQLGRALVLVDTSAAQIAAMKASAEYIWLEDINNLNDSLIWKRIKRGVVEPPALLYQVTALSDSGIGSLREALEAIRPRIVVFATSGNIELIRPIVVTNPHLIISGVTAPGGGICIKGAGIIIMANDVMIRYTRFRPGANGVTDGIIINPPARDVVLDHCSFSWAVDENVDIGLVHDIEVSWCIISEALNNAGHPKGLHSCGLIVGNSDRISIRHCLFACNNQRNPYLDSGRVDIINNIMYIAGETAAQITDAKGLTQVNFIGNYQRFSSKIPAEARNYVWSYGEDAIQIYRNDNIAESVESEIFRAPFGYPDIGQYMVDVPFPLLIGGEIQSAEDAYAAVLAGAGATLPARDSVDARIVRQVIDQTGGLIDNPSEVGGWPEL